jgi:hypothetical protein
MAVHIFFYSAAYEVSIVREHVLKPFCRMRQGKLSSVGVYPDIQSSKILELADRYPVKVPYWPITAGILPTAEGCNSLNGNETHANLNISPIEREWTGRKFYSRVRFAAPQKFLDGNEISE